MSIFSIQLPRNNHTIAFIINISIGIPSILKNIKMIADSYKFMTLIYNYSVASNLVDRKIDPLLQYSKLFL